MNKGIKSKKTMLNNFDLLNLSPRKPDKIWPINPLSIIKETNLFESPPNSMLKTGGKKVLNIVKDRPTTSEIAKNILRILFCFLSLKSSKETISSFLVFGMKNMDNGMIKRLINATIKKADFQSKFETAKKAINGPRETPIEPKTPWKALAFEIFFSKTSEINVNETGWWILAKIPKKMLVIANASIELEKLTDKAEINIPNCEKAISFLGPNLLYKKDIGKDPTP